MQQENMPEDDRIEVALKMITECYDILFDQAPVMMQTINREGYLLKVNQRWLRTLGYEIDDTMGRKCVDFMTDESRSRVLEVTLPILWQTGSLRSIGLEYVKQNGRVLNVLLNADPEPRNNEAHIGMAALWVLDDPVQRQQASTTVMMLQNLSQLEHRFEELLAARRGEAPFTGPATQPTSSSEHSEVTSTQAVLPNLNDVAREVSSELRNLALLKANEIHALVNTQANYLLLADTIQLSMGQIEGIGEGPGSRQ